MVLLHRSGIRNGFQVRKIREWKKQGVNVLVSTHNVKYVQQTERLVQEANAMAPVGGVFHLAVVCLANSIIEFHKRTVGRFLFL